MVTQLHVRYRSQKYTVCNLHRARIIRYDSELAEKLGKGVVMQAYAMSSPPFTAAISPV